MRHKLLLMMLLALVIVAVGCGSGGNDASPSPGGTATIDGEKVYANSCSSCHGVNLEGRGSNPSLSDVGARLSEAEILDIVNNGRGGMPGGMAKGANAEAVAAWLATHK